MKIAGVTALNGPTRLQGIDLARGLAVIGMFASHLLMIAPFSPGDASTWIDIANGRSSILFATLAGVSISLLTGGTTPLSRAALTTARRRLAVRAVLLWLIGALLIATGVPVFVILPAYALLFLVALPLLRLTARTLWIVAGVLALVMPWVMPWLNALPLWTGATGHDLALIIGWHYPFPLWATFLIAGMAIGRTDLRGQGIALRMLAWGAGVAAFAAVVAALVDALPRPDGAGYWGEVLTDRAHSGGLFEVVGSGAFAVAVIGACLLLCRTWVSWVVLPLRAVGSMPLTAYVGQLVAWAVAASLLLDSVGDLMGFRALDPFWPFTLATLALCTAWALLVGRGPLEWATAALTRLVAPR